MGPTNYSKQLAIIYKTIINKRQDPLVCCVSLDRRRVVGYWRIANHAAIYHCAACTFPKKQHKPKKIRMRKYSRMIELDNFEVCVYTKSIDKKRKPCGK